MSTPTLSTGKLDRRGLLKFIGGAAAIAATGSSFIPATASAAAPAILTGAGDIRGIRLSNARLGESLNAVYWVEGDYVPEVMDEISYLLRDWRQDQTKAIDPQLIDIIAKVHKELDTTEPFDVLSGFRSRKTNNMLRSKSSGVASNSYHIKGMATDLRLTTRSVNQVVRAGRRVGLGGVGKYSRSGFTHLDCGPQRNWGV